MSILNMGYAQENESDSPVFIGGSMSLITQNNSFPLSAAFISSGIGRVYSNNSSNSKNTTLSISPYLSKEISEKLTVGIQLNYGVGKFSSEDPVDIERNTNQYGIGLFTRHFLNSSSPVNFFIQPYVVFNHSSIKQTLNLLQNEKANYLQLGAGLGLLYNINHTIRATLRSGGINYVNGSWKINGSDTKNNFSSLGMNFNLSTIYFGLEIRI